MLKRRNIIKNSFFLIVVAFIFIIGGTFVYAKIKPDTKVSFGMYGDMIFRIDDEICDSKEVMLMLLEKKRLYDELYSNEIWNKTIEEMSAKDYLKYEAINELAKYKCVKLMARDKKIVLSNSEKSKAKSLAKAYIEQFSSEAIKKYGISQEAAKSIYEDKILFDKVFDSLTTKVNKEISVDEARVIKIQYIFVSINTPNAVTIAEDFYDRVVAGHNFEKMASDNNLNGEYECLLARGEVEENFEEAAFNLNSGENSAVIKTSKGYYIIKCINDYEKVATENNKQNILNARKNAMFDEIYEKYMQTLYYEINEKNFNKLDFDNEFNIKKSLDEVK